MKKIFFAACILLLTVSITFGQGNDNSSNAEVSSLLKSQFATDFPDARDAHFVSEKNFDEVSFTQHKEKISAYYDETNELVGTLQKTDFNDLPDNAKKEILKNYAGYTVIDVIKFDDNETVGVERNLYGISFDNGENYFVELKNDNRAIVLKVDLSGDVDFLTTMK
jgi:hypothetical protein